MVAVTVKTGPISAQDRPCDVPFEKWRMLVEARKSFATVKIPYDCRELLRFVREAREFEMIEKLGYSDETEFIRRGLGMDPETVGYALSALERIKPDWALPYREAVELGKRQRGIAGGIAGPGRGKKTESNRLRLKSSTRVDYTLARLDRDHPKLADDLRAGRLKSANAAAIAAGFRKKMISIPATDLDAAARIIAKHYDPTDFAIAMAKLRPDAPF